MGGHEDLEQLRRLRQQVEEQLQGHGSFGRHLRRLRHEQGMTLDNLARASGISKAYLSQIETGQVDPPRDDKVRSLEQVFAQRPGALLEPAHLARMPAELRERLRHLQSAFERAEETLQTVLEKLPAEGEAAGGPAEAAAPERGNVGEARPLRGRVPIINRVAAGYPAEFTDLGYPAGVADDYIGAPPVWRTPTPSPSASWATRWPRGTARATSSCSARRWPSRAGTTATSDLPRNAARPRGQPSNASTSTAGAWSGFSPATASIRPPSCPWNRWPASTRRRTATRPFRSVRRPPQSFEHGY